MLSVLGPTPTPAEKECAKAKQDEIAQAMWDSYQAQL
jgi:hypothetical protein